MYLFVYWPRRIEDIVMWSRFNKMYELQIETSIRHQNKYLYHLYDDALIFVESRQTSRLLCHLLKTRLLFCCTVFLPGLSFCLEHGGIPFLLILTVLHAKVCCACKCSISLVEAKKLLKKMWWFLFMNRWINFVTTWYPSPCISA